MGASKFRKSARQAVTGEGRSGEWKRFLRAMRARLDSHAVGLETSGRARRAGGLRIDEAAALANVGLTWYTVHASFGRTPDDPAGVAVIERLHAASPQFTAWWNDFRLAHYEPSARVIVHPQLGRLTLLFTAFITSSMARRVDDYLMIVCNHRWTLRRASGCAGEPKNTPQNVLNAIAGAVVAVRSVAAERCARMAALDKRLCARQLALGLDRVCE